MSDPAGALHRLGFEILDAADDLPPGPIRGRVTEIAMLLFEQFELLVQGQRLDQHAQP